PWMACRYQTSPRSASPASTPPAPPPRPSPPWSAASGRFLTTGSATPSTTRTTRPSAPDPGPGSWLPSGTSPSAHFTKPYATTSPKPAVGPAAISTGLSPFSDSRHDLETAVETAGDSLQQEHGNS